MDKQKTDGLTMDKGINSGFEINKSFNFVGMFLIFLNNFLDNLAIGTAAR